MNGSDICEAVLGEACAARTRRAYAFLRDRSDAELLAHVGRVLPGLRSPQGATDKRFFPRAYGGGKPCDDDVLAGRGPFYVTESGRVMLDAVSGHYQMTWGYNPPELVAAAVEGMRLGLVWDNHANTPGEPVRRLARRLVESVRDAGLDRALLGVCTGSVAAEAALKIALIRHRGRAGGGAAASAGPPPVMVTLKGNYHGTCLSTQALRGLWPGLVAGFATAEVEPNDAAGLDAAFREHRGRVAAFWVEPVMMNREALYVEPAFLRKARELCTEAGALLIVDEIQTGFWYPEVFLFRLAGLAPDIVVVGKGLTAGFHPLAGLLYRSELDVLEQYDAISTNGNATLAGFVSLCNLRLLERERDALARGAGLYERGLAALRDEFPDAIEAIHGRGFLAGLRFRRREQALEFHQAAVRRGLWVRVHAYHEGHRTLLTKLPLAFTGECLDFLLGALRELLATPSGGTSSPRAAP